MRLVRFALLSTWWMAACGSTPRPAREADVRFIARAEFRQDEAFGRLRYAEDRAARRAALRDVCGAAERVCARSAELDDDDARMRCQRARTRCRDARALDEAGTERTPW